MRTSDYPIHSAILQRRSSRVMSGEPVADRELMTLFEAARWAPSSYNAQPWRFLYAKRDSVAWEGLFALLDPFNKEWVVGASVLVLILSRTLFEHNGLPSPTHSFDAGAAWAYLALQGSIDGLVVHGMQGFDYDAARKVCRVPDIYAIEAMVAIGQPGEGPGPSEKIRKGEVPSQRKPLDTILMEGEFCES
ncbi:MAG: nitroreductase family protein [Simkaniaceae bacterium]|nr:nitroreductase family protein [Simkaniaceae bacterium]